MQDRCACFRDLNGLGSDVMIFIGGAFDILGVFNAPETTQVMVVRCRFARD